jgi:hypothetical protein
MARSRTILLVALLVGTVAVPAATGPAAAADVTLTITVVDADGDAVSDVELSATWDEGSTTETTRANGQALIDVPEGSDVEVAVSHDTYMRNQPYAVSDASTREVEIPVARTGSATVNVTDASGPVAGARVHLQDGGLVVASERTGSDGLAESGPIEYATYALIVSKPGYYEHTETVEVGDETELNVSLERGTASVSFSVGDDHYDDVESVANATIRIEPLGTSLTTLSDGGAETSLPVNTEYELTVSKAGYQSVTKSLSLGESGTEVTARINREAALSLAVANQQVVVDETTLVTVSDAYGDPVEGVNITVGGSSIGQTGADGTLEVPVEATGEIIVRASLDGLADEATVEGVQPAGTETPTASPTEATTEGGSGPGPGIVGALVALGLCAGLLTRPE